jgi:hypothetical protein
MNVYWQLIGLVVVTIGDNLAIYIWMDTTLSPQTKQKTIIVVKIVSYYL